ncbi:MAG: endonuclease MutS2 [Myxococcaceae bacterium]
MRVSDRSLEDLGLTQLRQALAARCVTSLGAARAQERPLLDDLSEVTRALGLVEEARGLRATLPLPLEAVTDVRPALQRARKRATLEARELLSCADAATAFMQCRSHLSECAERWKLLWELGERLPDVSRATRPIHGAIGRDGVILDSASPEVASARTVARRKHREIQERLNAMLRDDALTVHLRERYFSVRGDRYVLPVLSSAQREVSGIVHNASQSHQTLFVEPTALIELGNELAIAEAHVVEAEQRVLAALTERLAHAADALETGLHVAAALDETLAAASLSDALSASSPIVGPPAETAIDLRALRHPLLVLHGTPVVPNDLRLAPSARAWVISGPNAGGKTVTLTALGLCALMVRSGLPIPVASGASLPLFTGIHAAVGDAQDLKTGRSTFSAQLLELRSMLETAKPGTLVLVDEIGADTDPKEGAALALAVLEHLLDHGCIVAVTTHLEELKALAHADPRFSNARVTSDFALHLGSAGSSSALEVAEALGLPAAVCARARKHLAGHDGAFAQALRALEAERAQCAQEHAALTAEKAQHDTERAAWETTRVEAARRDAEARLQQAEERLRMHETALAEVREHLAQLKRADKAQTRAIETALVADHQSLSNTRDALLAQLAPATAPSPRPEIVPGAWVHCSSLGVDVEVLEVSGFEARVAAGAIHTRVDVATLSAPQKPRRKAALISAAEKEARVAARADDAAPRALVAAHPKCDVRGMRVDEALRTVDRFLDRALRQGEQTTLVLHGHGTGALKDSIREALKTSPYVSVFRPGESHEGGDGVTIVDLSV